MTAIFRTALVPVLISIAAAAPIEIGLGADQIQAPSSEIEVIYDESHDNVWGIWDTGFYGFSEFARTLIEQGLLVSCNTRPLDDSLLADQQAARKLLVLNVAKYQRYKPSEIDSIERFVKAGGKLLILGEHDNFYETGDFQNGVLHRFGLEFLAAAVGSRFDEARRTTFADHFGLKDVREALSAPIGIIKKPAGYTVLLEGVDQGRRLPIAVGFNYGQGQAIALGDSELFWNGDASIGLSRGDNRLFLLKIIGWLLNRQLNPSHRQSRKAAEYRPSRKHNGNARKLFIDTSSAGRGLDASLSGLLEFSRFFSEQGFEIHSGDYSGPFDVRVVAGPLAPIRYGGQDGRKLILFAEAFDSLERFSEWDNDLLADGYVNRDSIYSEIEAGLGVRIQPCFLTNGSAAGYLRYPLSLPPNEIVLHRAGALTPVDSVWKPWIAPADQAWCETRHPGLGEQSETLPRRDSHDINQPIFAAYNKNVLVVADSDLISNVNADQKYFKNFLNSILAWIDGRYEALTPKRP